MHSCKDPWTVDRYSFRFTIWKILVKTKVFCACQFGVLPYLFQRSQGLRVGVSSQIRAAHGTQGGEVTATLGRGDEGLTGPWRLPALQQRAQLVNGEGWHDGGDGPRDEEWWKETEKGGGQKGCKERDRESAEDGGGARGSYNTHGKSLYNILYIGVVSRTVCDMACYYYVRQSGCNEHFIRDLV